MVFENTMKNSTYWVYILLCENNTYYTGYTTNIEKRYQSHLKGTGKCKYTRSFKPVRIAQCWKITGDKSFAMKIESYIKKLSKLEKEEIIAHPHFLLQNIAILTESNDVHITCGA